MWNTFLSFAFALCHSKYSYFLTQCLYRCWSNCKQVTLAAQALVLQLECSKCSKRRWEVKYEGFATTAICNNQEWCKVNQKIFERNPPTRNISIAATGCNKYFYDLFLMRNAIVFCVTQVFLAMTQTRQWLSALTFSHRPLVLAQCRQNLDML